MVFQALFCEAGQQMVAWNGGCSDVSFEELIVWNRTTERSGLYKVFTSVFQSSAYLRHSHDVYEVSQPDATDAVNCKLYSAIIFTTPGQKLHLS